jgi:hypothetical protein
MGELATCTFVTDASLCISTENLPEDAESDDEEPHSSKQQSTDEARDMVAEDLPADWLAVKKSEEEQRDLRPVEDVCRYTAMCSAFVFLICTIHLNSPRLMRRDDTLCIKRKSAFIVFGDLRSWFDNTIASMTFTMISKVIAAHRRYCTCFGDGSQIDARVHTFTALWPTMRKHMLALPVTVKSCTKAPALLMLLEALAVQKGAVEILQVQNTSKPSPTS